MDKDHFIALPKRDVVLMKYLLDIYDVPWNLENINMENIFHDISKFSISVETLYDPPQKKTRRKEK